VLSATNLVSAFRDILHIPKDCFALFRAGYLIDDGIEYSLFLHVVEASQEGALQEGAKGAQERWTEQNGRISATGRTRDFRHSHGGLL
jgi:hypothetical protein